MKLMTLNIWGGHVRGPLLEFVRSRQDIDIFCFQEVYRKAEKKISTDDRQVSLDIFTELQELLPEFRGFFKPVVDDIYGICAFVKNTISVINEGEIQIHENPCYCGAGPTHSRNLQWLECRIAEQNITVVNVHGLWNGKGKTDCPERIAQAYKIRQFLDSQTAPKILCGDFNLRPDTESMKIIEAGMENLIRKYNVTSTRTNLYPKEEKFADYILISPEVKVEHFEVLTHEVSDHAPLVMHF